MQLSAPGRALAAIAFCIALAACGGGDGSASGAQPPTDGSSGVVESRSACQDDFRPERVDRGEDCAPSYHDFCASNAGNMQFTQESVVPCDGVVVDVIDEPHPDSFSGRIGYTVLRPAGRAPEAVLTNLHFRQIGREPSTTAATHAVQMRQAELVKARNVMVILPGAPGGVWPSQNLVDLVVALSDGTVAGNVVTDLLESGLVAGLTEELTGSGLVQELVDLGLPVGFIEDLLDSDGPLTELIDALSELPPNFSSTQDFMDYIELARADALERFGGGNLPQFMTGLSNGGIYSLRFACQRPELGLDAVMSVAGAFGPVEAEECIGNDPVGTVQVHGAGDVISPYMGIPTYGVRGGPLLPLDLDILGELPTPVPLPDLPTDELLRLPGLFLDVFGPNNNCSGEPELSVIPAGAAGQGENAGDVLIERFPSCNNPQNRRSFMVTIERGGHSWPGYDAPFGNGANINAFGAVSYDFDATLYGYDLLRRAAGLD